MDTNEVFQKASEALAPWAKETKRIEPNRLDVIITPNDLLAAVDALNAAGINFLSAITGLDLGPASGELEVLYHFCQAAAVVTLRVHVPRVGAEVPSVSGAIPSMGLFERELSEMFGITIVGAEYPQYLFLPDDWPEGVYPLRKDFQPNKAPLATTGE